MYGYNSVGMTYSGEITVDVEEDKPIEAVFSRDKLQVGNMYFTPKKDTEIVIKVTIKSIK